MFLLDSSTEIVASNELIVEKICRPNRQARVTRPRLLNLMSQGLSSCGSTILIGRAGTGKTTLAVDFAMNCGRQTCWYKVDAPDADITVFSKYLINSLRRAVPGFGSLTLKQIGSTANYDRVSKFAEAFVYELEESQSEPLLIVIDDLHLICDAGWVLPFFQRVLPLLPAHVHMLITSRTMPPAPLWRMRSKQTLLVIDEDTLAFSRSEANQLFESYGLSVEQASIAVDHTLGRAASLAAFAARLGANNGDHQPPGPRGLSLRFESLPE